jgi:lipopolysaccharide heptosyltransferase II
MSPKPDSYKNILIIRQAALGDVANILPLIKLVRDAYPEAKLTCLTAGLTTSLLEADACVDEVISFNRTLKPHRLVPMMVKLKSRQFDLVIDFQGSSCTRWLAWSTGAAMRIGSKKPPFYTHPIKVDIRKHQACDVFRLFLAPLGLENMPMTPRFPSLEACVNSAKNILKNTEVASPYLVFNPGHSPAWGTKHWPEEHWVKLGHHFIARGYSVVVSGGPGEIELSQRITGAIGSGAVDLAGKTDLFTLAGVMNLSSTVVSTDSGPMHVAAMSGTKVVALFGPTHPLTSGPFGAGHKVLHHELHCSYCFKKVCPYQHECLDEMTPDEVMAAVQKILTANQSTTPLAGQKI